MTRLLPQFTDADYGFMRHALALARTAEKAGEVPVGAVVVRNNEIVSEGYNRPIASHDPTAHAEIVAMRAAAGREANYRLSGATIYVTLEPCLMCVGAMVNARIERLVYAARDLRFGAVRSKFSAADSDLLNHSIRVEEGLMAADAAQLLKGFFERKRDV